jgi:uncharacterized ferredoxin-like protein
MKQAADLEREAVLTAASQMAAAARTAPKTRGVDNIEVFVIDDEKTKKLLMDKMIEVSKKENRPSFKRDANSIAGPCVILAIGIKSSPCGLNCGFCGYATCDELKKTKGICAYNSIDLGIAMGSAASLAGRLHVDNRMMHSIGRATLDLKLFGMTVGQALGIPLSVTGKNPYFDRK